MEKAPRSRSHERPRSSSHDRGSRQSAGETFIDRRPEAIAQRQLVAAIERSGPQTVVQRRRSDGELPPGSGGPVRRDVSGASVDTGLPGGLKAGIESLSGMSMDDVRVSYNSPQPAQLNALAYAQGSDIHLGPGQEGHLPHEAWHVVQQARGLVAPTTQLPDGLGVNDDERLEREAEAMGKKAAATRAASGG